MGWNSQMQAQDDTGKGVPVRLQGLPDKCPVCHHRIEPQIIGDPQIVKGQHVYHVLRCPSQECKTPFFGVYNYVQQEPSGIFAYSYSHSTPIVPTKPDRSRNIEAVSPSFYAIFDQANAAEQYGLSEIAGPGHRKALEFLIKDYASREARERLEQATAASDAVAAAAAQSDVDTVRSMALANVIANRIQDDDVRDMAARAAWLGNDETHYTRLWANHDLEDLKHLLSLVTGFVDRKEQARRYREQMPKT